MDYQLSPLEVKMQQELAAFCRTEIAPQGKDARQQFTPGGRRIHEGKS